MLSNCLSASGISVNVMVASNLVDQGQDVGKNIALYRKGPFYSP